MTEPAADTGIPAAPEKDGPGRPRRTDWQEPFLEHFALHGVQAQAARAVNVSWGTVKTERGRDPEFARRYDEAFEESTSALELAAYTWARGGLTLKRTTTTTRTLKDGKVETTTVETETLERSPAMTIFMLKSRKPDVYRDRLTVDENLTVSTVTDEEADAATGAFDAAVVRLADARTARQSAARRRTG